MTCVRGTLCRVCVFVYLACVWAGTAPRFIDQHGAAPHDRMDVCVLRVLLNIFSDNKQKPRCTCSVHGNIIMYLRPLRAEPY